MISLGCDVGSLYAKAVVLQDERLLASRVMRTTGQAAEQIPGLIQEVMAQAGLRREQVDRVLATGNGAELVPDAEKEDVVACVGAAAAYYLPEVVLSIDVGGQSATALLLTPEGEVADFMRNDKCASGSGRFLEVMSEKLNLALPEIDAVSSRAGRRVEISNQCGVFAESEVISHLNQGVAVPDIIAGVCDSVARMVTAQARRFPGAEPYTLTGGVAKLQAVVRIVREKLGGKFQPFPHDPQLAAALGAALLAQCD